MAFRIGALIPGPIRRPLRQLLDGLQAAQRSRALTRCIAALRSQVRTGAVEPELVRRLRAAWGNESYSADATFVAEVAARVLASRGPFLDCGSGLSTLMAGVIAGEHGATVWSLEQDEAWYLEMRRILARHGIANVLLRYTPLRSHGDFAWYDTTDLELPSAFTHVFCDGPAVHRAAWPEPLLSNWRAGLVPLLQQLGVDFGEILLDDAEDRRCPRLCQTWNGLGVATEIVPSATGPYVLARVRPSETCSGPVVPAS